MGLQRRISRIISGGASRDATSPLWAAKSALLLAGLLSAGVVIDATSPLPANAESALLTDVELALLSKTDSTSTLPAANAESALLLLAGVTIATSSTVLREGSANAAFLAELSVGGT